jgi:SAM-dependent methyltransferase
MYQLNNLYEKYKERILSTEFSSDLPDVTSKITLNHINHAINLCKKWDSALDIGCGNGHYLAALSSKFRKNIGIEIDTYKEHETLTGYYENIKFFKGKLEEYSENEKIDFILLMDIFEHIPDISSFMQKIKDLQDKNGIVYLTTPNPHFCGPAQECDIYYKKSGYHGHIDHYTKKEIIDIFSDFGYEMEFCIFEETKARGFLKILAKGFSRRDRRFSKKFFYKLSRPIFIVILKLLFKIIEIVSYKIEKKYQNDIFNTQSFGIVFKKIVQ